MQSPISIFWFRQDLRLADNPGLLEAANLGKVLPIYIYDSNCPKDFELGAVSKIWLHQSLLSLQQALKNNLNFYCGKPEDVFNQLSKNYNIENIFWGDCYEPWVMRQEQKVKNLLNKLQIKYKTYNSCYLWSPKDILKDDGTYYKVFTAYKNKSLLLQPRLPLPKPKKLTCVTDQYNKTELEDLNLIPKHPWAEKIMACWSFGEAAAVKKLLKFIQNNLAGYKQGRDYPDQDHTSKLSPHLHFGEISPYQIWDAVNSAGLFAVNEQDSEHFINEITWREFSCYLMAHFENLYKNNFQSKFNDFPWQQNKKFLKAWQTGQTGYPIIDAGMRELWQTGYMHNRVRMIVASFLTKNLMIHWHYGRDWFWDCLVDADLANNSASWQWVAGSGADAAPYFRIFNPITQGEKFDADGSYTKKFVPELKKIPSKYLFAPWQAPEDVLKTAGIILGKNYPKPIVEIKTSREAALSAYHNMY